MIRIFRALGFIGSFGLIAMHPAEVRFGSYDEVLNSVSPISSGQKGTADRYFQEIARLDADIKNGNFSDEELLHLKALKNSYQSRLISANFNINSGAPLQIGSDEWRRQKQTVAAESKDINEQFAAAARDFDEKNEIKLANESFIGSSQFNVSEADIALWEKKVDAILKQPFLRTISIEINGQFVSADRTTIVAEAKKLIQKIKQERLSAESVLIVAQLERLLKSVNAGDVEGVKNETKEIALSLQRDFDQRTMRAESRRQRVLMRNIFIFICGALGIAGTLSLLGFSSDDSGLFVH